MSLHLILGSPGTGKSTKLREELICHAMENPGQRHILLVPEQFTMQTQRDIVAAHPRHAVMNIEVLSFERLAYRLLGDRLQKVVILTDTGKNMLLRRAVGDTEKEIRLFRRSLKKAGFISHLMQLLSEFWQYGVTEEELGAKEEELSSHALLAGKLRELRLFFHAMQNGMEEHTIAAEELLPVLARELQKENLLSGTIVAMDHFTGFTPVQQQILTEIIRQAEAVWLAMILPEEEDEADELREGELFYMSRLTCFTLERMAEAAGKSVTKEYLEIPKRWPADQAFAYLSRHYLRYGRRESFHGEPETISCHLLRSPREEALWAAGRIQFLVREKGYRYRDIAVITGDLEEYRPHLRSAFRSAIIPVFLDRKRGVLGNPLVEYLRSALTIFENAFSYESIFRFLRCGLSPLGREETDLLDLYVEAAGIRGQRRWQEKWERIPDPRKSWNLEDLNRAREKVMEILAPLLTLSGRRDVKISEYAEALLQMTEEIGAEERMEEMSEKCRQIGESELAEENRRIRRYLQDFLQEMKDLLGNHTTSRREFLEILDAGLSEAKLGQLPSALDQVQVGDVRRSRLTDVKVLFVLGMNEGRIPGKTASGGILSEWERELLRSHSLELAPSEGENALQDRFYLYMLFTRPSEELIITLSRMDGSGTSCRPSHLLSGLLKIFPALRVKEESDFNGETVFHDEAGAWQAAASGIRQYAKDRDSRILPPELQGILWELFHTENGTRLAELLEEAFPELKDRALRQETAAALYGKELTGSISRLECFAACEAKQFYEYGLQLRDRTRSEWSPAERGTFFHRILESFFRVCQDKGLDVRTISEEERMEVLHIALQQAEGDDRFRQLTDASGSAQYQCGRWERLAGKAVWAICKQLSEGQFTPEAFEWAFSGFTNPALQVRLEDEARMILNGVVDRIDIWETDEKQYVRIVDYKTGEKSLDLGEIYEGLSLQLILYLEAVLEAYRLRSEKPVHPGGVYYYPVRETQVDAVSGDDEARLLQQTMLKWKPAGLSGSAQDLVTALGKAKGNKITEEQFEMLGRLVRKRMTAFGEEILSGKIAANPYRHKKTSACDYCRFLGVCGFDPKRMGSGYRRIPVRKADEIWNLIQEAADDGLDE